MNKEMKRSFRIFILKILAVVFVLCICYFLYAFVYRAKTELPTKAVVTNRGAAVYTLRGQKQMLSQKEDFSYFAFDGREKEKEYGTYVIPGLKNTRTLLTKKGATPAMCTSMRLRDWRLQRIMCWSALTAAHRNIIRSFM